MRIWIDFSTAPDPLYFRPLISRLHKLGHTTWLTAREFSETTQIARYCNLSVEVVGRHGGPTVTGKAGAILYRAGALARRARQERIDLAVGFNSYAQAIASQLARVPLATCMDYEYQPANHLAFRLADRVIVPEGFDAAVLRQQGGTANKVVRHYGLKEHVTLVDFQPDLGFPDRLAELGIGPEGTVAIMRPPATWSAYHRFENALFEDAVRHVASFDRVKIVLLPRYPSQADHYRALHLPNLIIPNRVLDGLNLVYWSDLVVSAGGSMNREAVVLGVPAYTIFAGRMAGVDRALIATKQLGFIRGKDDLLGVRPPPKRDRIRALVDAATAEQVTNAILGTAGKILRKDL